MRIKNQMISLVSAFCDRWSPVRVSIPVKCFLFMLACALAHAAAADTAASTTDLPFSSAITPPYPSSLSNLQFLNYGTVRSADNFTIRSITSIYNEGYTYMGRGHTQWTSLGSKTFS